MTWRGLVYGLLNQYLPWKKTYRRHNAQRRYSVALYDMHLPKTTLWLDMEIER